MPLSWQPSKVTAKAAGAAKGQEGINQLKNERKKLAQQEEMRLPLIFGLGEVRPGQPIQLCQSAISGNLGRLGALKDAVFQVLPLGGESKGLEQMIKKLPHIKNLPPDRIALLVWLVYNN